MTQRGRERRKSFEIADLVHGMGSDCKAVRSHLEEDHILHLCSLSFCSGPSKPHIAPTLAAP
jgi:hypothetical protein